MAFYPVNLKISERLCLVVGGGNVALRKIRSLIGCNAKVTVISPRVVDEIHELAEDGDITLYLRGYRPGDLAGTFLVFAATDNPEIQAQVGREARERNILLNSADDPHRCDFQVPATVRRGDLLLTISTGGASPALSKLIREQLEEQFNGDYGNVIALFARIRELVVPGPGSSAEHKKLFQKLLQSDIVEHTRKGEWDRVTEILEKILPSGVDAGKLVDGFAASGLGCSLQGRRERG